MSRGCRIKNKLSKGYICNLGISVIKKRYDESTPGGLDIFGEPTNLPGIFAEETIKIVIKKDKRHVDETHVGGLPEGDNKELLHFHCSADVNIQIGDKIVYPPNTPNEWIIFSLIPNVIGGVVVLTEVKCHRDSRK